mmetsp:Transcript_7489/g.19952  ORF Transcript_7489/g.19952 Transcript_7489/m.19952 type:complete len:401 (-) Transcript_7489:159-1361(-)
MVEAAAARSMRGVKGAAERDSGRPGIASILTRVQTLSAKYDVHEVMGAGARSMVLRVVRRVDAREFAVKVVAKTRLRPMERVALAREVAVFHHVHHPNIVGLEETLEDSENVYIVTELLTGGDLCTCLNRQQRPFTPAEFFQLADQMFSAVAYLHSRGIAHRDIKLENFALCSSSHGNALLGAKLIDFGMVFWRKPGGEMRSTHSCGTLGYAAPEVCANAAYIPEEADMFSLGVVLYAMVTARLPYEPASCAQTAHKAILKTKLSFDVADWSLFPVELRDLVAALLHLKPSARPTAAAAVEALSAMAAKLPEESRPSSFVVPSEQDDSESCLADTADLQLFEFIGQCDPSDSLRDEELSPPESEEPPPDASRRKRNNSLDEFVEFIKDVLFRPPPASATS